MGNNVNKILPGNIIKKGPLLSPTTSPAVGNWKSGSFSVPSNRYAKIYYPKPKSIQLPKLFLDTDHVFYIHGTRPMYFGFWVSTNKRVTREMLEKNISSLSLSFVYADRYRRNGKGNGTYRNVIVSSGLFKSHRDLVEMMEKVYDASTMLSSGLGIPWTVLSYLFEKFGHKSKGT